MKLKTLFALLLTLILYSAQAQQTDKFKKHEIGIDAFILLHMGFEGDLNNFNLTYKYHLKKYALKIRVGGDAHHWPGNEDQGLNFQYSHIPSAVYFHSKHNPGTNATFYTTIGAQYNYLRTAHKTFFIGFDIRGQFNKLSGGNSIELFDTAKTLVYSNIRSNSSKTYSLSPLTSMGFNYRFKAGFGITYEIAYGFNFHKQYHDDKYKEYNPKAGTNSLINDIKNNKFSTTYWETEFNIISNLTLSYLF